MRRRVGSGSGRVVGSLPSAVSDVLSGQGTSLDGPVASAMEAQFGHSFADVRIHTDHPAAVSADAFSASAYTVGRHVVFGAGTYQPHTATGRRLIAHELVHTMQTDRARPVQWRVSSPDDVAEVEAERLAAHVGTSAGTTERADVAAATGDPVGVVARAGFGEAWDAVWGVGPVDAMRARNLATESLARAEATGLPGLHNGLADAWRHAYWNCRMAQSMGADQAATIAANHEEHGGGPAIENDMDTHNNAVGRTCSGDCDVCVQGQLDTGRLRFISGGALVPTTGGSRTPTGAATGGGYY